MTVVHNNDSKQTSSYEELFLQFSSLVERWLIRIILGLLTLLLIFQLLLQYPSIRYFLVRVEQLEGVSFIRSE
ncbi:hypothetical protein GC093_30795 [Paenibacillus sp. LMG 31456]|uniref:Uncharacterized protein n=1 Tax=Paenibacillus foliorum TaxID=2654974 RepID=A0A972K394_9BACL|nr:hypothetical protein [Paenibacillus foliorum]